MSRDWIALVVVALTFGCGTLGLFLQRWPLDGVLRRYGPEVKAGRRPVFGGTEKFQRDPNWRDHLLFYEYFHGDNGAGLGASHQTGWTGVIATLIEMFGKLDAQTLLKGGREAAFGRETERT